MVESRGSCAAWPEGGLRDDEAANPPYRFWDQKAIWNRSNDRAGDRGWHIDTATGINEVGQICGTGTHPAVGGPRAILLTP